MNISITKMETGEFFVCADDDRKEQLCQSLSDVEEALLLMGIDSEEVAIAAGLLESGTHTTVWIDAYGRVTIEDGYGKILA